MADQLRVVILDDEALARERLFRLVEALPNYRVEAVFADGLEAIQQIDVLKPDLALLDISMPGVSGIEVARHISEFAEAPAVVFCTAFDEYAVQAFEAGAVGYILKPVRPEKLKQALESASRLNKLQISQLPQSEGEDSSARLDRQSLRVKSQRGIQLIPMAEVYAFVADGKYVTAKHTGGNTLLEESLAALEGQTAGVFVRCHRSALVRIDAIASLDRSPDGSHCVSLTDEGISLPVSRRHIADLRSILLADD